MSSPHSDSVLDKHDHLISYSASLSVLLVREILKSTVWPVISYGAAIWGTKSYSCINAVQNRAMRFFLGTGKYMPNAAIYGDMGWQPPLVKQWKCICNTWDRLKRMPDDRLNKRVFVWSCSNANNSCKNGVYTVKKQFQNLGHGAYADFNNMFSKTSLVRDVSNVMLQNSPTTGYSH